MRNRFFAFLLVAAIATFTGRTALASSVGLPAIQINGAPLDASALNCAAAGSQTVCRGTDFVGSGFELNSWEFLFDPDPSITGSFTLTNLSSITQGFSVSA